MRITVTGLVAIKNLLEIGKLVDCDGDLMLFNVEPNKFELGFVGWKSDRAFELHVRSMIVAEAFECATDQLVRRSVGNLARLIAIADILASGTDELAGLGTGST